jgi:hypothetical protein
MRLPAAVASATFVLAAVLAPAALGAPLYTVTDLGIGLAYGIYNAGEVVGQHSSGGFGHAFLYSGGVQQRVFAVLGGLDSAC